MGGGVGGPDLAAAVRDAGGFGMVSGGEAVPSGCGVNFLVPYLGAVTAVAEASRRSDVVEFFYGWPDVELVRCVHDGGALAGWQVGSADEAAAAAAIGCDYVIAQGLEAGGHDRGHQSLDDVLSEVLSRVPVPVVAAGGIGTRERVGELLDMGADAVRIGTRFLACPESRAHPDYVDALLGATAEDTTLTEWFDEGFPDAPHRVLRHALDAAQRSGRRSPKPPSHDDVGRVADMAQYAGTGVDALVSIESAETVLNDLVTP
jgi:NAD(P)H-dependent flavin oxidoreductase YrpB (nitropropane dioxygenase family)